MNKREFLSLSASAALGIAVGTDEARSETKKITISHPSPATSHFGLGARAFKEAVESNTGGRFEVFVQRLDNEREAMESVQLGSQEFSLGSTGPAGNFVPDVRVFDIPYLFRDRAHARGVVDSAIGKTILAKFESAGLIGVAFAENGIRHLTTSKADIRSPADLAGLKIRTMENKVHLQAWQAAAVLPTPMAFSELPPALQQGTVDGQENPIPVILANNFDQLQKYLYLTGHVYSPGIMVGNPDFWNGLSKEDRKAFEEAAAIGIAVNRKKVEDDETNGVTELKKRGMLVREVDRQAFQDAMASANAEFESQFGAELISSIRDWKAN